MSETLAIDWRWPSFRPDEFVCSHCGVQRMDPVMLDRLQHLRALYSQPVIINSGYRCPQHPLEASKPRVGGHAHGRAVDIRATPREQRTLRPLAISAGFTGFGAAETYLHIDDIQSGEFPLIHRPASWDYR